MKILVYAPGTVDGVALTSKYMEITNPEYQKRLQRSSFKNKAFEILEDTEEIPENREQFVNPFAPQGKVGMVHSGPDISEVKESSDIPEGPSINELRQEAKSLGIKSAGKSKVALVAEIEKAKIDG